MPQLVDLKFAIDEVKDAPFNARCKRIEVVQYELHVANGLNRPTFQFTPLSRVEADTPLTFGDPNPLTTAIWAAT
jgi:hypothetical protein